MSRRVIVILLTLCLLSCSHNDSKCWTVYIEAFGLTEERLFWGTDVEVAAEAQLLRDIAAEKQITAQIYFEPSDMSNSDCNPR